MICDTIGQAICESFFADEGCCLSTCSAPIQQLAVCAVEATQGLTGLSTCPLDEDENVFNCEEIPDETVATETFVSLISHTGGDMSEFEFGESKFTDAMAACPTEYTKFATCWFTGCSDFKKVCPGTIEGLTAAGA